ncbi:hypothetical protein [Paraburkholderia aromaticivorans]|uniref:hypothetical protein n=1 Tax=Paraburkholderia aromaticivorans TaxID=2026199 RepID=UPI001ABFA140|nr:hypothetical protein [Paraburkholderia aromaticivorans]
MPDVDCVKRTAIIFFASDARMNKPTDSVRGQIEAPRLQAIMPSCQVMAMA